MIAWLPADEEPREAATRAYQMLDFLNSQLADFFGNQEELDPPSERLAELCVAARLN